MADNSNITNSVSGLSETELAAVVAFKEVLNTELPQILPQETASFISENSTLVNETSDPYAIDFLNILDKIVENDTLLKESPALQEIANQYAALSDNIKAHISGYRSEFTQDNTTTPASQAAGVIANARQSMGLGETFNDLRVTRDVDGAEGYLIAPEFADYFMQHVNKFRQDGDTNSAFTTASDKNSVVAFLEETLKRQAGEAGIQQGAMNQTLTDLRLTEQKSISDQNLLILHTSAMLDMAKLMNDGSLPSGGRDNVFMPSSNNNVTPPSLAEDRFFSADTYVALKSAREVPATTFFADNEANPHVDELKLAAKALHIDTENGTLSEIQVGQIARKMLEYQACKLGIEKHEINEAIHVGIKTDEFEGRFMPNTDDLHLASIGVEYSQEVLDRAAKAGLEDWEIPLGEDSRAIYKAQNDAWADDFGALPQSVIDEKAKLFSPSIPQDEVLEAIERGNTMPHQRFRNYGNMVGDNKPTEYENDRQEYLAQVKGVYAHPVPSQEETDQPSSGINMQFETASDAAGNTAESVDEMVARINAGAVEVQTPDVSNDLTQDAGLSATTNL